MPHGPARGLPPDPPPDATPTEALPDASDRARRRRPDRREVVALLRREAPLLTVLLVAAYAFWRIALQHWREGTTELGVALLLGAVLRAVRPEAGVGLLAVRSRRVDVITYAATGLVVIFVSLTITGGVLATR